METPQVIPESSRYGTSRRSRGVSFALALAASLLLFATLIAMGQLDVPSGGKGSHLVAVDISGEHSEQEHRAAQARPHQVTASATASAPKQAVVPPIVLPSTNHYELPPGFIQMSRADMTSADIGHMHSAPAAGAGSASADAGGGGNGAGEGPGGATLYNAQWYREPTDAEMGTYLPHGAPHGAWAMIACKTIDHYHVEDCQELDESPRGSGLARGLRQAAWQFLVRPPRIDGKPMIGAWVRIRFDFTKGKREDAAAG